MSGAAAHFQSHDVENRVESRLFLPFRTVSLSITSSIVGISFWSCSFFARSTCIRTARLRSCWPHRPQGGKTHQIRHVEAATELLQRRGPRSQRLLLPRLDADLPRAVRLRETLAALAQHLEGVLDHVLRAPRCQRAGGKAKARVLTAE